MAEEEQAQHLGVEVVRVGLVKPAQPTIRHTMWLSGVDRMLRVARPSRTILFYRCDKDPAHALQSLRQGLASALVPFYPMAGRLVVQEGDNLALDCSDQGVELIECRSDLPFAELQRDNYHVRPLFRQLVPQDSSESSDVLGDPVASFQVTRFVGGLTVGIAISHCVADGYSVWAFIRAVAEACRGEPSSMSPLHARILLKPEAFMMGTSFPGVAMEDLTGSNAAPFNGCDEVVRERNLDPELLEQKIIVFSQEMLETLKKTCSSDTIAPPKHAGGSHTSTYQALAAYLWKRLTMAQGLEDQASLDLRVSMDVRNRMIPPLTLAYFGNAVVGIPTPTTCGELIKESLGATATRIRQSTNQVDDLYIKRTLISCEKMDLRRIFLSPVQMTLIHNGISFPVYEAGNFGWGEPEAVRPPWNWREGEFTWYPGKLKPKSIEVIASLTQATCSRFFSPHLYPNDPLAQSPFPFAAAVDP